MNEIKSTKDVENKSCITYKKAMLIADRYYSDSDLWMIAKVYEAKDMWIIIAKRKDDRICFGGGNNITISKRTGEIKKYVYSPSSESSKLLQEAKLKFSSDKNPSLL